MPEATEVRGNTLRVYIYILRNGPSELREVQHGLGMSTPSLAFYHLGKLMEAGYVKQDERGKYSAVPESSGKILVGYTKIGTAIVPQLFFFALLFTILTAFFSYETLSGDNFVSDFVALALAMVAVFWFETARLWRGLA